MERVDKSIMLEISLSLLIKIMFYSRQYKKTKDSNLQNYCQGDNYTLIIMLWFASHLNQLLTT